MHERKPCQPCVIFAKIHLGEDITAVAREREVDGFGKECPGYRGRVEQPEVVICQVTNARRGFQLAEASFQLNPRARHVFRWGEASQQVEISVGSTGEPEAIAGPWAVIDSRHDLERVVGYRELVKVVEDFVAWFRV